MQCSEVDLFQSHHTEHGSTWQILGLVAAAQNLESHSGESCGEGRDIMVKDLFASERLDIGVYWKRPTGTRTEIRTSVHSLKPVQRELNIRRFRKDTLWAFRPGGSLGLKAGKGIRSEQLDACWRTVQQQCKGVKNEHVLERTPIFLSTEQDLRTLQLTQWRCLIEHREGSTGLELAKPDSHTLFSRCKSNCNTLICRF